MAQVPTPVADRHVHSEWSWDAAQGDMMATCARAVELGLPALAFTEHADFTLWVSRPPVAEAASAGPSAARGGFPGPGGSTKDPGPPGRPAPGAGRTWSTGRVPGRRWPARVPAASRTGDLDIAGYWAALERCRGAYPSLRIESGIELGEPHLFPDRAAELLAQRPLDRVLGSLHCIEVDGELVDLSMPEVLEAGVAASRFRGYLLATLALVESGAPFAILTHLDYPKRYWPHSEVRFDERDFEEEYRAVLAALARSGRALELNSSRAMAAPRAPSPGLLPLRWWHEEGGGAVSFGSDAHRPQDVGAGLVDAAQLAEAAGFRPGRDPLALWCRA